jgi:hypothetical protein
MGLIMDIKELNEIAKFALSGEFTPILFERNEFTLRSISFGDDNEFKGVTGFIKVPNFKGLKPIDSDKTGILVYKKSLVGFNAGGKLDSPIKMARWMAPMINSIGLDIYELLGTPTKDNNYKLVIENPNNSGQFFKELQNAAAYEFIVYAVRI